MLLSKQIYESVLPANLKKLLDERTDSENLRNVAESLRLTLKEVKAEIVKEAEANLDELEPRIKESEDYVKQVEILHEKIDNFKRELEEQENFLKSASEVEEYKSLLDRIEEINTVIEVIESIQTYETCLNDFKTSINTKEYAKCHECLVKLTEITNESSLFIRDEDRLRLEQEGKIKIDADDDEGNASLDRDYIEASLNDFNRPNELLRIRQLREEFVVQRERLWFELDLEWDRLISVESSSAIKIDAAVNQTYLDQIATFARFKYAAKANETSHFIFESKLKQFSKKLLRLLETSVFQKSAWEIEQVEEKETGQRCLTFKQVPVKSEKAESEEESENTETAHNLLKSKFAQVETVLQFLSDNFFKFTVPADPKASKSGKRTSLMELLSAAALGDFIKLIHEQLIVGVIPLRYYEYGLEAKICQEVGAFEKALKRLKFVPELPKKDSVFDAFVRNVEELYIRKKCRHIMETGRELMKQKDSIFEVVRVKNDLDEARARHAELPEKNEPLAFIFDELLKIEERNKTLNKRNELDEFGIFQLNECSISVTVKRVTALIYETFNEAIAMVESVRNVKNISLLCLVAKNLFDLYICVVPTFHKENLKSIPMLSAICFNDFMYLAYNCLTISHQYKSLFLEMNAKAERTSSSESDEMELEELVRHFTCLDLVPKFCAQAYEILYSQVNAQEAIILQLLNEDTNGLRSLAEGSNFEKLKQALRKCSSHLNRLSSVWISILPTAMYLKIIGSLVNLICDNLLRSCLKLEDISTDDASYMNEAFQIVQNCAYELFSKKHEENYNLSGDAEPVNAPDESKLNAELADLTATKYVPTWQRFKYLMLVLKASLKDIVDYWSDGNGPLALHFDSEEVRNFIRALFMISDRRSAALARIK